MKGVDDFLVLLAVAIVIIIVFSLTGPISTGQFEQIASFSVGDVGAVSNLPSRSIQLGSLTIGEPQKESLKSMPQLEVSTGLFDSKKYEFDVLVPDWLISDAKNVRITADVNDANRLNDIVVKWNGKEFYRGKPDAVSFSISKEFVKSSNVFSIYAEGPGLAFWASNYYMLRNVDIDAEYGTAKIIPFQMLGQDIESFSRAELDFYGIGSNPLAVKVNGKEIYAKTPRGAEKIMFDFSNTSLKAGTNVLSVFSEKPVNLYDAKLNIFLSTSLVTRTNTFDITDMQYNAIGKGRIDIRVDRVSSQRGLKVQLFGRQLTAPQPSAGILSVYFSKNDAQIGRNTIDMSGTGSFYIGEVKVGIER